MYLTTWIDKTGGTLQTAKFLGIKRNAVYAWRHGVAFPRPATMKLIVDRTRGRVSYKEMIEEYVARKKKAAPKAKATKAKGTIGKSKKVATPKMRKSDWKKLDKLKSKNKRPSGAVAFAAAKTFANAVKKKSKGKKVDPGF